MDMTCYEHPNAGDVVGCRDDDIGIVLKCYQDECYLMIEVAWSSGQVLTDPWDAEDFESADSLFHIMSRV